MLFGDLLASAISGVIPTRPWWTFSVFLAVVGLAVGLLIWL
jgi:hypothetical protein